MSPTFKLFCNYSKCYSEIKNNAWVTACAHIFCKEHGTILQRNQAIMCPVCQKKINNPFGLYETKQLHPDKEYKNVLLMGMEPYDVFQIACNAVNFWINQINEHNHLMSRKMQYYREKFNKIESILKEQIQKASLKIAELNEKLKQELNENRRITSEMMNLRQKLECLQRRSPTINMSFFNNQKNYLDDNNFL